MAAVAPAPPLAFAPAVQRNFPSDAEWHLIMQTAAHVWRSGMANDYGIKSESSVILVMLKGWELGLPLMGSLEHVRIIHGRVSISAECQQALVLARVSGARFKWVSDGRDGKAEVTAIRPGHADVTMAYTMADAQQGGVAGKNPTYRTWPAALLRAGAMRNVCRMQFADVILGLTGFDDGEVAEEAPPQMPQAPAPARVAGPSVLNKPQVAASAAAAALPPAPRAQESKAEVVASSPMREPGDDADDEAVARAPLDQPLPFSTGPFAGKALSDIATEAEFRRLITGFRDAAAKHRESGNEERATDRLGWAELVAEWAKFRGCIELAAEWAKFRNVNID